MFYGHFCAYGRLNGPSDLQKYMNLSAYLFFGHNIFYIGLIRGKVINYINTPYN